MHLVFKKGPALIVHFWQFQDRTLLWQVEPERARNARDFGRSAGSADCAPTEKQSAIDEALNEQSGTKE